MAFVFRSTLVSILSLLRYRCTKADEVDPVYAMKACERNRVTAPLILRLGIGWRGVVKCTSRTLCLWERDAVPVEWGLDGPQRSYGHFGEEKNLLPLLGFESRIVNYLCTK